MTALPDCLQPATRQPRPITLHLKHIDVLGQIVLKAFSQSRVSQRQRNSGLCGSLY